MGWVLIGLLWAWFKAQTSDIAHGYKDFLVKEELYGLYISPDM